ncbi:MAG: twin-arginine translocase TatA/TatE family subunit [Candidatus Latescibacteria bacterium]|nr:twin-arginine translocase TatA/TatE family subunit [Candidatus Latescibacterota bacterium]
MLSGIGLPEILVIFLLILLLFGAKRIPEMAQGMGKGIKEFKKAMKDVQDEIDVSATTPRSPNTIAPTPPANQVQATAPAAAEKKEPSGTSAA